MTEPHLPRGAQRPGKTPNLSPEGFTPPHSAAMPGPDAFGGSTAGRPRIPDVGTLLLAATRRFWLCALIALPLGALAAAGGWYLTSSDYIATSFLRVRMNEDYILRPSDSSMPGSSYLRFQEKVITLPHVLQRALNDPTIAHVQLGSRLGDRETWLRNAITVSFPKNTELLDISIAHEDAESAQLLVNAVTRAYLAEVQVSQESERERKREELERLTNIADQQLKTQWESLQEMARNLGTGNPQALSLREQIQLESYREYAQRLRQTRFAHNTAERDLQSLRAQLENESVPSAELDFQHMLETDATLLELRRQLSTTMASFAAYEATSTSSELPEMQDLRRTREHLQQQLDDRSQQLRQIWNQKTQLVVKSRQARDIQEAEATVASYRQEEIFLAELLEQLEDQIDISGGDRSVELEMLRHEIERQERVADNLWDSLENLRIEEQAHPRVSLIQWAEVPEERSQRKRARNALLAGQGTMLLIVLAIGYIEYQSGRIRKPTDLGRTGALRLFTPDSYGSGPSEDAVIGEAAAALLHLARGSGIQSVLVTSARSGEGKGQLAIGLARRLASAGRQTLLVDVDFRSTELADLLGQPATTGGFAEMVRGGSAEACTMAAALPMLDVLPAGERADESYELLAGEQADALFEKLRERYELLIINAPAMLESSDTLLIAHQADVALLSTKLHVSRAEEIQRAQQSLTAAAVPSAGVVVFSSDRGPQSHIVPAVRASLRRRNSAQGSGRVDSSSAGPRGHELHRHGANGVRDPRTVSSTRQEP